MELHLKVTGFVLLLLGLLHIIFPRYFKWKSELAPLSLINRQLMEVHTFFIALVVLLMGLLCLTTTSADWSTPMGKLIAIGFAAFWIIRLVFQFLYYSPALWRGKRFETIVHVGFSLLWVYLSTLFVMLYRQS